MPEHTAITIPFENLQNANGERRCCGCWKRTFLVIFLLALLFAIAMKIVSADTKQTTRKLVFSVITPKFKLLKINMKSEYNWKNQNNKLHTNKYLKHMKRKQTKRICSSTSRQRDEGYAENTS